jgi:hypothetical protein
VRRVERRYPWTTQNTYFGHPWSGWDGQSFDVWGAGGRGTAISLALGYEVRAFLMQLPGAPYIRHTIYLHSLWTSYGGYSYWAPDDHDGWLRHVHVTYW